jgi:hypothetical protein
MDLVSELSAVLCVQSGIYGMDIYRSCSLGWHRKDLVHRCNSLLHQLMQEQSALYF